MRLKRAFFERPALEVAPDLLGCRLVHQLGRVRLEGVIVEVEAYIGDGSDAASHSHRGPTPRSAIMFGPPGRFYVYRCMGIHACANLVCEPVGRGAAVLLRAVEPRLGLDEMCRRRGGREGREIASGPGRLSEAFGIELAHNGTSAMTGRLRIEARRESPASVLCGPRIGIRHATELPYRFWIAESPHVTRTPLNRRAAPLFL